jgi:hypothetical protein
MARGRKSVHQQDRSAFACFLKSYRGIRDLNSSHRYTGAVRTFASTPTLNADP